VAKVLKGGGVQAPTSINVIRSTEQLPIALLDRFAKAKVGEVIIYPAGTAIVMGEIRSTDLAPTSLADATPLIEHYLANRDRTVAARNELERLRSAAVVAYQGEFAELVQGDPAKASSPVANGPAVVGAAPADEPKDAMARGIRGLK
jgi:hypothetical protein